MAWRVSGLRRSMLHQSWAGGSGCCTCFSSRSQCRTVIKFLLGLNHSDRISGYPKWQCASTLILLHWPYELAQGKDSVAFALAVSLCFSLMLLVSSLRSWHNWNNSSLSLKHFLNSVSTKDQLSQYMSCKGSKNTLLPHQHPSIFNAVIPSNFITMTVYLTSF